MLTAHSTQDELEGASVPDLFYAFRMLEHDLRRRRDELAELTNQWDAFNEAAREFHDLEAGAWAIHDELARRGVDTGWRR